MNTKKITRQTHPDQSTRVIRKVMIRYYQNIQSLKEKIAKLQSYLIIQQRQYLIVLSQNYICVQQLQDDNTTYSICQLKVGIHLFLFQVRNLSCKFIYGKLLGIVLVGTIQSYRQTSAQLKRK
ncbi:Hypothetical_protein [Hexamita inflata]|uniref:Hypothetical_protein n=1 Tax=Hexamita inflata TaxID=28002 RepID=A0ABP1HPQ5_9EUKA